jgi:hypothetical protein
MKTIISHLPDSHEVHELLKMDEGTFSDLRSEHLANQDLDCESKMYFESVKWYESYEDVGFIEEVLGSIDDEEWLITRVGEEQNDIEQTGGYWDSDVYVSRSIQW